LNLSASLTLLFGITLIARSWLPSFVEALITLPYVPDPRTYGVYQGLFTGATKYLFKVFGVVEIFDFAFTRLDEPSLLDFNTRVHLY